ncbi:unnamed protein product [Amoebophrya sp. A120]|nr:unnamed protein product [Amoebophrya sp. A120]|eukprot:GSA120T00003032001.1
MSAIPADAKRPPLKHEIGEINERNLGVLKVLLQKTFPITYGEGFYQDVLTHDKFCRYAFVADVVVGSICARVQDEEKCNKENCPEQASDDTQKPVLNGKSKEDILYLMTLSLLPAYRKRGIASALLEFLIEAAKKDENLRQIALHVQTSNDVALKFYQKHGFEIQKTVPNYYQKIEPTSAHFLTLNLKPSCGCC